MNLIYFQENQEKQNLYLSEDFELFFCQTFKEVKEKITEAVILIIDSSNPLKEISSFCKLLRTENYHLPILILSEDSKLATKISLLNAGADDYLEKPYDLSELEARIKSLKRRYKNFCSKELKIKDFNLDKNLQALMLKKEIIQLTKKEFLILEYFIKHPDELISRADLLEHAWGLKANYFSKSIEMHILHLRKKINPLNKICLIKTVSGRGYIFSPKVDFINKQKKYEQSY